MRFERALPGTNEVFLPEGVPRTIYESVLDELERTGPGRWEEKLRRAHGLLLEEQRSFGILEGDKTHPTDWIPRIVPASDWERLVQGLEQRLRAINEFLRRLEAGKEEVVPREVIESSILYDTSIRDRFGAVPVRQIAFDVVAVGSGRAGETGGWEYLIIEENAKMPVGLAPMTRRRLMSSEVFFPESYERLPVHSLDGWL
ncbi:MAG: circularly permuted type 2 ATP-grasp protein, partial [Actinobacteria bacterium]|nr:circularly permuted type 2 ATP-grasp protein [Actinomycetota bacterium]